MNYYIGQGITTKYESWPVKKESQYPVGSIIDISDEHGVIAEFEVTETDEIYIFGRIVKVYREVIE